ncbi:MAG: hypothetical protein FJ091_09530 [Deltaproteobacteria bacterium]|nr:hypothetical protein [Deltaproteobacteria bacterium]
MRLAIVAAAALLAASSAEARVYTFVNLLDSTQQTISTNAQCLAPSINSLGEVALLAGSGATRGIYKASGGSLTLLAGASFGGAPRIFDEVGCRGPSINDQGRVAFWAETQGAGADGIYIADATGVYTVADSTGPFGRFDDACCPPYVMLNENGLVAFVARFDAPGPEAIYVGNDAGVLPVYSSANTSFERYEHGPAINDAGKLAFFASNADESDRGLFVGNGGALSKRLDYYDACSLSLETNIDNTDRASFAGDIGSTCPSVTEIYLTTATTIVPAALPPVISFWFDPPSFANNGEYAFNGMSGGLLGVYVGGTTSTPVIRVGDPLFGSTVASAQIGRQGANAQGQVVFWYSLANGVTGYARADATPDCANGIDDDADGKTDLLDAGCSGASDLSERTTLYSCDDGLDNDADGLIDYPSDIGCANAKGKKENPQCSDGIDNDGDTFIDYPADTVCTSPTGSNENPPPPSNGCGIGPELAAAIPLLAWLRRRRRGAA